MTSVDKDGTVHFRFYRPAAAEVALAGDFSGWSNRLPMRRDANGWWTLDLALPPGEYRFRYVADGEWYTDFASHGVEVTTVGWNSLLVVPDGPLGTSATTQNPASSGNTETQLVA